MRSKSTGALKNITTLKQIDGERLLAAICMTALLCGFAYMVREMLTLPEE